MSDRVAVDLQALIDFRSHLISFNLELAEDFSNMRHRWQALGEVWTDAKYHEFGEVLTAVTQGIDRYLAVTDDHEAHLQRKIEAAIAFLER